MAKLIITAGPDRGKEFLLEDTQIMGRLGRNPIPLKDTRTSRQHARVYRSEGRYFVADLNSKNGTFVNGDKVRKSEITPGDEVLVGETYFTIEYDDSDVAITRPTPGTPQARAALAKRRAEQSGEPISVSDVPLRSATSMAKMGRGGTEGLTRTSFAWLRTDLAQVSGLYRLLVTVGLVLLTLGLGYFAFTLVT